MNFNEHSAYQGLHAFLSASSYHWVNYSPDKLRERYRTHLAAAKGTRLHELAAELIALDQKLPDLEFTLNMFVNDTLGFKMKPEQILYYSDNCFGTADSIGYIQNILRIFDLKTGVTKCSMLQLKVYAALFCLEYKKDPVEIEYIELRIYQNDDKNIEIADPEEIQRIMDKIIESDKIIDDLLIEEGYAQ